MSCLAETLIYLLAVLGIIFTSMTFFEMFFYNGTNNKFLRYKTQKRTKNNLVLPFGSHCPARTGDPAVNSRMLYRLS